VVLAEGCEPDLGVACDGAACGLECATDEAQEGRLAHACIYRRASMSVSVGSQPIRMLQDSALPLGQPQHCGGERKQAY
jgi:hypothetical protein